jgi:large subunit ribosomal protein L18
MSAKNLFERRKNRVRFSIKKNNKNGRVRLVVSRTNQHIYAQLIDDAEGKTIAHASTLDQALSSLKSKSNVEAAKAVGALIAKKAKDLKLNLEVVFDRGGYLFHGRVKALADAAREGGLNF